MLLLLPCHTIHMQNRVGTSLSPTPFLSKQAIFVFPDNTLNSQKAEDNTDLLILAPVAAAARPQPSRTEEPVTAGPTLCL